MPASVYEIEKVFDPSIVHSSSVNTLLQCGVAFKMRYIDGLPEERSGSAALFGLVMHRALEWWAPDRTQSLLSLTEKSWAEMVEGTALEGFLNEYRSLSKDAIRLAYQITQEWADQGKESKAPRMTKQFKESRVARDIRELTHRFYEAMEDSPWRFTHNDPLPSLYDESLVLSKRYEARWKHLRPALQTEFKFAVPWRGFTLKGTIDCIEGQYGPRDELVRNLVTDYKSYGKEPPPFKDWRQGCIYFVAVREMIASGKLPALSPGRVPLAVGFDYLRWNESWESTRPRVYMEFGERDEDRLEAELWSFRRMASEGLFLPAQKNYNPDFCAYPSRCCLNNSAAAGGEARVLDVRL